MIFRSFQQGGKNIKLGLNFDPELQFLFMNDRHYLGNQ